VGLLLTGLLALVLAQTPAARAASACQAVEAPPDAFQVAWVSPVRKKVHAKRYLEVVRTSDLRVLVRQYNNDATRVLQALGMVGKRGGGIFTPDRWKVTIFDVEASWLCRPMKGRTPGEILSGLQVCSKRQDHGNRFFTGCGYSTDTVSGGRGLDTFRVRWRDASRWGFCVMPWERFLSGA